MKNLLLNKEIVKYPTKKKKKKKKKKNQKKSENVAVKHDKQIYS